MSTTTAGNAETDMAASQTITTSPQDPTFDREAMLGAAPDEVVTHTRTQRIPLPGGRTLALLTLDNGFDHNKPTTFGPAGLFGLADAVDALRPAIAAGEVDAVAVTGKPFIFAAGADLKAAVTVESPESGREIARLGHAVFRRFAELGVPTFGFVNGAALGGGVELPLHCTYRTISSGVPAFALPECMLGLVPGWGGAYLLPRLVGPAKALDVIIRNPLSQNRMLKGPAAFELGYADAIFEPADFLEKSIDWAARVLAGEITVDRVDHTLDQDAWASAVQEARAWVDQRIHNAAPAPLRALDLVEAARTNTPDEGYAAEDDALGELIVSGEFKSGVYSFDLVQKRAKRPAGAPDKSLARKVTKVGVVGAGLMASQLAMVFARNLEVPVVMSDLDDERVQRGLGFVHSEIDKLAARGRLSPDGVNKLKGLVSGTTDTSDFADADLVIEAVFEEMSVKKQVFGQLEGIVREDCILATNTSSLSVTEMGSDLAHPERVVGIHFFNPVAVLPLVEVVVTDATDDATAATAFDVVKKLKKTGVKVKDVTGFVVNRLLMRFIGDVTATLDEGTDPQVADASLDPLGLPMRPFDLTELVGPAVALHVVETLHGTFPERFRVARVLQTVVENKLPSLYVTEADGTKSIHPTVAEVMPEGPGPDGAAILDQALVDLAKEIRLMLDEGVVAEPQDIDLCMIMGAGWPFHLGGICPFLDRSGISERATGRRFLTADLAAAA